MTHRELDVLAVPCPICDAEPDAECVDLMFRAPRERPHSTRRDKARLLQRSAVEGENT